MISLNGNAFLRGPLLLVTLLFLFGCSNDTHPLVPDSAKLIWSGIIDSPNDLKNIHWESAGHLYLTKKGEKRVEEARTVWPEKKDFTFTVAPGNHYDIYFIPDTNYIPKEDGDGEQRELQDQSES